MTFCVYAVVGRLAEPAPRFRREGASGERLRVVRAGPVAAVVGAVARRRVPTADLLRRYEGTIAAIAATVPAVLPVRFGTCIDSLEEVRSALTSQRPALQAALARVRHRVQMTVRIPGAEDSGAPPERRAGRKQPVPGSPTGAAYLHARAADAARERQIPGFAPVAAAVRRWVRDERVEKRAGVATVYHLIPRTAAARYRSAAVRAAAAAKLQVIVSGPWAPYAFAGW